MYNFTFGTTKTWDDLELSLDGYEVQDASVIESYIHIPFTSRYIDLTSFNGFPAFNQRKITSQFTMIANGTPFIDRYNNIVNLIHGKKVQIKEPRDTGHYYMGRVNVGQISHNKDTAHFEITATCEPYKLKNEITLVSAEATPTQTILTLTNESMPCVPSISTSGNTFIKFGNSQWSVNAGVHKLAISLEQGDNYITIQSLESGNVQIQFAYQEGAL